MPIISVFKDCLDRAFASDVTEESFEALCFEFGLELDAVTSEKEMARKERGPSVSENLSERVIYKVEVPANRYDLLCLEGLVRALRTFKGLSSPPPLSLLHTETPPRIRMMVHSAVAQVRPFVVCAVLRGVSFDKDRYDSFIDLQDKLHQNICRKRKLASIGTHDLSTLTPPFSYEAQPPENIRFVPLKELEEMDGVRLMEHYAKHEQLKVYLPILRGRSLYPVIYDSCRTVCSLPPIINSEHSKIRLDTRDVFIEITAEDCTKAGIVLNTLVAMFSEYCELPFTVEPVLVEYAADYPANTFVSPGDKIVYPNLASRPMETKVSDLKSYLSLADISGVEVRDLLRRMSVPCELSQADDDVLEVQVPVTRSDIMHECDLVEDIAIAYGYNNLLLEVPSTFAGAATQPINHLSDLVRVEMAMAGFVECLNWGLISKRDNFDVMRHRAAEVGGVLAQEGYFSNVVPVQVSAPKTKEFEIVRTSLLPCIFKTLTSNKHQATPLQLFEVGDVIAQEPSAEVGARNKRRVAALHCANKSNFSALHGCLDQLMYALGFEAQHEHQKTSGRKTFLLVPSEDEAFVPGMQAHVVVGGTVVGLIGEVHPEVLGSRGFDVNMPTSAFEMDLEPFLDWL